jgi:hypothetical protein
MSWTIPGSPSSIVRSGTPAIRRPDDRFRSGPVRLDQRGHGLGIDPDELEGPQQRARDLRHGGSRRPHAPDEPGDAVGLVRSGADKLDRQVGDGGLQLAGDLRRDRDGRQRAARPGGLGDAPESGLSVRVGEGRRQLRHEDYGSDGHGLISLIRV